MSIIYDMASGRTESQPVKNNTVSVHDELILALEARELSSDDTDEQPRAFSIHLVRALLRKNQAS